MLKPDFEAAVASAVRTSRQFDPATLLVVGYGQNESGIALVVLGQRNRAVEPSGHLAVGAFYAPPGDHPLYVYGPNEPQASLKGGDLGGRVYHAPMADEGRPGLRVEMVPLLGVITRKGVRPYRVQADSIAVNDRPAQALVIDNPRALFGTLSPGDIEQGRRDYANLVFASDAPTPPATTTA